MDFDTEKIISAIYTSRKAKGKSQKELAEALGITQGAYGRLENGKSNMTLNQLETICKFLEISFFDILSLSSPKDYAREELVSGIRNSIRVLEAEIDRINNPDSR